MKGKIFQAFAQVDNSSTRNFGGTGLGFTICSCSIHLAGKFGWKAASAREQNCFEGVSVLIVDDNATNRRILVAHRLGLSNMLAGDGATALRLLAEAEAANFRFSLVLTDAQMPAMDGIMLIEAIRSKGFKSQAAILMLTSVAYFSDAERCQLLGTNGYLTKPIRQSDLRKALKRILEENGRALENSNASATLNV